MKPLLKGAFEADMKRQAERMEAASRAELEGLLHRLCEQEDRIRTRAEEATEETTREERRMLRALMAENLRQQKQCLQLLHRR